MAAAHKGFKFSLRMLQMIIISTNTIAAVQSCPPSMIYNAQSGIQATTTVVLFMCCSFRTHFKGAGRNTAIGCKLSLRADIAGIGCHVSMLLEVAAKHCVYCHPWLLSLAAYCCRHSFCMCNAQLGSPHMAVHCLVQWWDIQYNTYACIHTYYAAKKVDWQPPFNGGIYK